MNVGNYSTGILGLVLVAAWALAGTLATEGRADFILWDDEQFTVNTSHSQGTLYDQSTAEVRQGGYIENAYAYNHAQLRIMEYYYGTWGTSVRHLYAYDTSAVDITGGDVGGLSAYDTSTVDITGGEITSLGAHNTSAVDISGGEMTWLYAYNTSAVDFSGGDMSRFYAYDTSAVYFTGGKVSYFYAYDTSTVDITGGKMSYLNAYDTSAVDIAGGEVVYLNAYDTSAVSITGGEEANRLDAYDTSIVDISGGEVDRIRAYDTSAVAITGGEVRSLSAYNTSTVDVTGGLVNSLYASDVRLFGPERLNISGGSVERLTVSICVEGSEELTISKKFSSSDLVPYGILFSDGIVNDLRVSHRAYDTSTVEITGGSVWSLSARDTSTVDIAGGSVEDIYARDTSTVDIAGGSVEDIYAYNTSTVDISGGLVSSLYACDTSTTIFVARDFRFGEGLSLDGDRVLGVGVLSGEWFDGTLWEVNIAENATGATILVIPEPATVVLLGLGLAGLVFRRRRNSRCAK